MSGSQQKHSYHRRASPSPSSNRRHDDGGGGLTVEDRRVVERIAASRAASAGAAAAPPSTTSARSTSYGSTAAPMTTSTVPTTAGTTATGGSGGSTTVAQRYQHHHQSGGDAAATTTTPSSSLRHQQQQRGGYPNAHQQLPYHQGSYVANRAGGGGAGSGVVGSSASGGTPHGGRGRAGGTSTSSATASTPVSSVGGRGSNTIRDGGFGGGGGGGGSHANRTGGTASAGTGGAAATGGGSTPPPPPPPPPAGIPPSSSFQTVHSHHSSSSAPAAGAITPAGSTVSSSSQQQQHPPSIQHASSSSGMLPPPGANNTTIALSSVESPIPTTVQRCLGDRSYDKRKNAALEIESLVKNLQENHHHALAANTTTTTTTGADGQPQQQQQPQPNQMNVVNPLVLSVIAVLSKDFATSMNANYRKGGLIGIAATAIGLMSSTSLYLNVLLPPVLHCFDDPEARVRYYACESLYNITKVARTSILQHFNFIFEGLCKLYADVDVDVKNGATLLDRLLKDVVTESCQFNVELFIPLLQNYIRRTNPYIRQLLVGWITVLDGVPDINMLDWLPDFLDGLFNMLSDSNREIRQAADSALSEFLREVKESQVVEFGPMVAILVLQCHSKERLNRLIAITWISEFIHLGQDELLPFHSDILGAVMRIISDDEMEIRRVAERTNDDLCTVVRDTWKPFELSPLLVELTRDLASTDVQTKMAALRWINMLLEKKPRDMNEYISDLLPVLLSTLSDVSDAVVLLVLQVLSRISLHERTEFHLVLNAVLDLFSRDRALLEHRGSLIVRKLCVLLNAKSVYIQMAEVLSSKTASGMAMVEGSGAASSPSQQRDAGDSQGRTTTSDGNKAAKSDDGDEKKDDDNDKQPQPQQQQQFSLEFVSTMVQTLNLILLTASELHELRSVLQRSFQRGSSEADRAVFVSLYSCWCHNPVATFSLCLLAQAYDVSYALVQKFTDMEVTVGFLMQVDKLVQLLESPIFVHLRLQLLDVDAPYHAPLLRACYGLLMMLPQSDAFRGLNDRLATVCNLRDNNVGFGGGAGTMNGAGGGFGMLGAGGGLSSSMMYRGNYYYDDDEEEDEEEAKDVTAAPASGPPRLGFADDEVDELSLRKTSSLRGSVLDSSKLLERFDAVMDMHRAVRDRRLRGEDLVLSSSVISAGGTSTMTAPGVGGGGSRPQGVTLVPLAGGGGTAGMTSQLVSSSPTKSTGGGVGRVGGASVAGVGGLGLGGDGGSAGTVPMSRGAASPSSSIRRIGGGAEVSSSTPSGSFSSEGGRGVVGGRGDIDGSPDIGTGQISKAGSGSATPSSRQPRTPGEIRALRESSRA